MWELLKKVIKIKFAIILLASAGAWNIYQLAKPVKPNLDQLRLEIAEQACWSIIDSLPKDIRPVENTVVLRFAGDKTRYVTSKLEDLIERTGKVSLMDKGFFDKVLRELKIEDKEVGTFDKALEIGKKSGADYVIFGDIEKYISDRENARLKMNVRMIDIAKEKVIMANVIDLQPSFVTAKVTTISPWSRVLFWLLFTIFMPLIFIKLVRHVLSMESNAANFTLVLSFTAVSFFLALILAGFDLSSLWIGLLLLAGLITSVAYNYWICNYIEELRDR